MKSENSQRILGYLQQCLSSDKRPLSLFLGAGCPLAVKMGQDKSVPLIPDISGITQIVRNELSECSECGPLLKVIEEHFKTDGMETTSIEDMLTHIRSLRAVAGNAEVRGLSATNLDKLDKRICQIIYRIVDKELPGNDTPYHYVAAWVDSVRRENPIEVFTTNYDLLMEQAFEDNKVPYYDGFTGVRKPFFDLRAMEEDMLPPRWARLWKIHGSINWYQVDNKGVFRGTSEEEQGSKRVIHPSHLKYQESRRLPYLAMMDRLRAFFKHPTATLITCGYSYRDEHINEIIIQGLEYTQTAVVFALLYGDLEVYSNAIALALRNSNLNLLANNGAVIGGQKVVWQEREAEQETEESVDWLAWKAVGSSPQPNKQKAELLLGDFAIFGKFLHQLIGNQKRFMEQGNVN
ncbi:MAG: SIR2 family NAD-dependent protein deacylase [Coriobacteriia bacterium]